MIYLCGSGIGCVDNLTVKAKRIIEEADVLMIWYSTPIDIVRLCKGMLVNCSELTLKETVEIMALCHREGKNVVRLHDGDLSIYGCIQEEIEELDKRGIPWECIPGISAFQVLSARIGRELALPGISHSILIARCNEDRFPTPNNERIMNLAKSGITMLIYSSIGEIEDCQSQLLKNYPKDTAVVLGENLGSASERIFYCQLDSLVKTVRQNNISLNTIIMLGKVFGNVEYTEGHILGDVNYRGKK